MFCGGVGGDGDLGSIVVVVVAEECRTFGVEFARCARGLGRAIYWCVLCGVMAVLACGAAVAVAVIAIAVWQPFLLRRSL